MYRCVTLKAGLLKGVGACLLRPGMRRKLSLVVTPL